MSLCVVESGFENDPLLKMAYEDFSDAVVFALPEEVDAIELDQQPAGSTEEAVVRDWWQLKQLAQADMLALWAHGQVPKTRTAVLAGFAAARRIPIVALRSQPERSGEDGLMFNLMLHAAIEYSLGRESLPWDAPLSVATSFEEVGEMVQKIPEPSDRQLELRKLPIPYWHRTDDPALYPPNPFGFAESTRGFYYNKFLPVLRRHTNQLIDPWTVAEAGVEAALAVSPKQRARAWTAVGVGHLLRVIEEADCLVMAADQEPMDVGSLVEVGAGAAFGKPIGLYRNDLRVCSEREGNFSPIVQAAAAMQYETEQEVRESVGRYAQSLDELDVTVASLVRRVREGR